MLSINTSSYYCAKIPVWPEWEKDIFFQTVNLCICDFFSQCDVHHLATFTQISEGWIFDSVFKSRSVWSPQASRTDSIAASAKHTRCRQTAARPHRIAARLALTSARRSLGCRGRGLLDRRLCFVRNCLWCALTLSWFASLQGVCSGWVLTLSSVVVRYCLFLFIFFTCFHRLLHLTVEFLWSARLQPIQYHSPILKLKTFFFFCIISFFHFFSFI